MVAGLVDDDGGFAFDTTLDLKAGDGIGGEDGGVDSQFVADVGGKGGGTDVGELDLGVIGRVTDSAVDDLQVGLDDNLSAIANGVTAGGEGEVAAGVAEGVEVGGLEGIANADGAGVAINAEFGGSGGGAADG